MNLKLLLAFLLLVGYFGNIPLVNAQSKLPNENEMLEEVVVTSFKEGSNLDKLPAAVSVLGSMKINRSRIEGTRDLSTFVPNLFIPDYGSKLTSAIYIRGVGSRIGSSAIGMYVNNVPFLDKTAYDFDFFDIKRIEVLRGPQGTLYGRNSMGGLINIYTLTPWDFQGTRIQLSGGSHGWFQSKIMHYNKVNNKLAFSLGGNLRALDGFQKNEYAGKVPEKRFNLGSIFHPYRYDKNTVGATQTASVRGSLEWKPNEKIATSFQASYEYTDQNGYPYGKFNRETLLPEEIKYNDENFYKRHLFNNSIQFEYQGKGYKIVSTTGYQHLEDQMLLDQDFTEESIFGLVQEQKINAWTEEIVIRSTTEKKIQWVGGISGFHQQINTEGPVRFQEMGVKKVLQPVFDKAAKKMDEKMGIKGAQMIVLDDSLYVPGSFKNPNYGMAGFFQGTYNDLFFKGLSMTAGLRLDYEKTELDYYSAMNMNLKVVIPPPRPMEQVLKGDTAMIGVVDADFTQLLPKLALKYSFAKHHVYATVNKGYRAGGFNVQMFSDITRTALEAQMDPTSKRDPIPVKESVFFKPEYSWNYEVGARGLFLDDRLTLDMNLFYLDIFDQQIAEFAPNGQGRMIKNAGRSVSKGIEGSLNWYLFSGFTLGACYGYTNSTFKEYIVNEKRRNEKGDEEILPVDYSGNYVPFVPSNTLVITASYTLNLNKCLVDRLVISGQYSGAGKIYWTETNDIFQKYYSLINGKLSLEKNNIGLSIWGRNITNNKYATFYFETFGKAFGQLGRPVSMGMDLTITF